MKNIDEFSVEEIGEEWLRELYKVVALRRGTMFRMITETARLLLFGNAGGAALIIGFMSASTGSGEDPAYHWASLLTLLMFATGTLASAMAMIMVAVVSVKEAHGAETALKQFVDGEIDRTQVMFTVEEQTFRLANYATASGVVSAVGFLLGGLSSIILLILFF